MTRARTIVEVGTHFGGSARAMAEGQHAAGITPNVLTFDVEDRAGAPILGFHGIVRVLADVRDPVGQERLSRWLASEPIGLLYVDALKNIEFIETTLASLLPNRIMWMVVDDIFANASIRAAWDRISREYGSRATTIDDVLLNIRSGGYGQGIVAVNGRTLEGLSIEPLRAAAHRRWNSAASKLSTHRPNRSEVGVDATVLREAVECCTGEGEVVVVGGDIATTRALAEAVDKRADLDRVSVNVLANFLGDGWVRDQHYGPPVTRGEPSLAEFRRQLGDAAPLVNLIMGDVPSLRWPGRPIELLTVGWRRDPAQLTWVWRELLPWCVPGGSLLLIHGTPQALRESIRADLGELAPHLEVLGVRHGCVALCPVSTPDAVTMSRLTQPLNPTSWSRLGVPLR